MWAERPWTVSYTHLICHDTLLAPNPERFYKDVGIVAQTMLLGAVDMGLGGIMIGNFAPEKVRQALGLRETLVPVLILALGKPDAVSYTHLDVYKRQGMGCACEKHLARMEEICGERLSRCLLYTSRCV